MISDKKRWANQHRTNRRNRTWCRSKWYYHWHATLWSYYGPLAWYVKLQAGHVVGMLGTFSSPLRVSDLEMHHGMCLTHVPWCMLGSLISIFLWSRWRGKCSGRMRNTQFYVSGKRPMPWGRDMECHCHFKFWSMFYQYTLVIVILHTI